MRLTGMLQRGVGGPVRLALSAGELGLEVSLGVVRAARALLGRERPGGEAPARGFGPVSTAAPPTPASADPPPAPEAVSPPPPVPPAAASGPAVAVAAAPPGAKGVDDEPVKIAEFGEEGAEEDAGPNVRVEAPWDGYDGATAAQIQKRIADSDSAAVAAVALYERSGRARRTVIRAAERRLRLLSA